MFDSFILPIHSNRCWTVTEQQQSFEFTPKPFSDTHELGSIMAFG